MDSALSRQSGKAQDSLQIQFLGFSVDAHGTVAIAAAVIVFLFILFTRRKD
jgi:hypothetical protein